MFAGQWKVLKQGQRKTDKRDMDTIRLLAGGSESMPRLAELHPEIAALRGVQQDPGWHPEGDVFVHTGLVLDRALEISVPSEGRALLLLAALCHDFGKPAVTQFVDGRWRAYGHEERGVWPTMQFLDRIGASQDESIAIGTLVRRHLVPITFPGRAKRKGYQRLGRELQSAGVRPELLAAVSLADKRGRGPEAAQEDDSAQVEFLKQYWEFV